MERPVCRRTDLCVICEKAQGVYLLKDGVVCQSCMPDKLAPHCSDLRVFQVRNWIRDNGYDPESSGGAAVSSDRSMGITQFDDVVLADELNASFRRADSVDMVVSFIKASGLNLVIDSVRSVATRGRVRVVTTAYMGATEPDAVLELASVPGVEVRMDLGSDTRIHAKGFIFNSKENGGTVYVGSANLSRAALTSGEEWVVKIRERDLPQVVEDFRRSFEHLWGTGTLTNVTEGSRAYIEAAVSRMGMHG